MSSELADTPWTRELVPIVMLVASWLVTTAATFAIVILDERRLRRREEALERAWPPVSRDAAIIAFGPLALLVHFPKTRGSIRSIRGVLGYLWGLALGVIALALVLAVSSALLEIVAWALGAQV